MAGGRISLAGDRDSYKYIYIYIMLYIYVDLMCFIWSLWPLRACHLRDRSPSSSRTSPSWTRASKRGARRSRRSWRSWARAKRRRWSSCGAATPRRRPSPSSRPRRGDRTLEVINEIAINYNDMIVLRVYDQHLTDVNCMRYYVCTEHITYHICSRCALCVPF